MSHVCDRPEPYRLIIAELEQCHDTDAGIYIRDNPAHVRFPRPKEVTEHSGLSDD